MAQDVVAKAVRVVVQAAEPQLVAVVSRPRSVFGHQDGPWGRGRSRCRRHWWPRVDRGGPGLRLLHVVVLQDLAQAAEVAQAVQVRVAQVPVVREGPCMDLSV